MKYHFTDSLQMQDNNGRERWNFGETAPLARYIVKWAQLYLYNDFIGERSMLGLIF